MATGEDRRAVADGQGAQPQLPREALGAALEAEQMGRAELGDMSARRRVRPGPRWLHALRRIVGNGPYSGRRS